MMMAVMDIFVLGSECSRLIMSFEEFEQYASVIEGLMVGLEVIKKDGTVQCRGPLVIIEKIDNRVKSKRKAERRKARLAKVGGSCSQEDLRTIWQLQGGRCYYSDVPLGQAFETGQYQVDHIIPVQLGGTNWPSNIALATKRMNLLKSGFERQDFLAANFGKEERKYIYKRIHRIDRERRKLFPQPDFCQDDLDEDLFGPCFFHPTKPISHL